jgi:hypothetical protein
VMQKGSSVQMLKTPLAFLGPVLLRADRFVAGLSRRNNCIWGRLVTRRWKKTPLKQGLKAGVGV